VHFTLESEFNCFFIARIVLEGHSHATSSWYSVEVLHNHRPKNQAILLFKQLKLLNFNNLQCLIKNVINLKIRPLRSKYH